MFSLTHVSRISRLANWPQAEVIIDVQKKVAEILGIPLQRLRDTGEISELLTEECGCAIGY
jgi:hypothetical protein